MGKKAFQGNSTYKKRLLPYFILFSIAFTLIISAITLYGTYKYAYYEARNSFYDTYRAWISDMKQTRLDLGNRALRFLLFENTVKDIRFRDDLANNRELTLEQKKDMVDNISGSDFFSPTFGGNAAPPGNPPGGMERSLFIDPDGTILFSRDNREVFTAYDFFNVIDGIKESREWFLLRDSKGPPDKPEGEPFYMRSRPIFNREDGKLLGYLVLESPQRQNLLVSSVKNTEVMLLTDSGAPLTDLKYKGQGTITGIRELPYSSGSNVLFDELSRVNSVDEKLLFSRSFYRNYGGILVLGAGAPIKDLNLLFMMEIPFFSFFQPYLNGFLFIILTLAITQTIFVLVLNRLDISRLKALDANPLTHLPGNNRINATLQNKIDQGLSVTVIYTDLDHFKAYNDQYGFSRGDDIIIYTASILKNVTGQYDRSFCGHIGGDDFICIVPDGKADEAAGKIIEEFDRGVGQFYREDDRSRGYILSNTRTGETMKYPFISISLAGVRLNRFHFSHYLEVSGKCAELKKLAKESEGSVFVRDRRKSS